MLRIFRLIFRWLRGTETRPKPRLVTTPPVNREVPAKRPARSAVEISALIEQLPQARVQFVCDGDTVIVATLWRRTKIRLDSIDCPEDGQHWGNIATAGLIKLIGGRTVVLEEHGEDNYGRTLATLYVYDANKNAWQNVNERMVTLGHAWVMRMYYDHLPQDRQAKLNSLEAWAQSKKVGLWSTENPIPPWLWRRRSDGA